ELRLVGPLLEWCVMHALIIAHAVVGLALPPMRPDTPPPLPVPVARLVELKTMEDVIAVTLLEDGRPAPSYLVLPELLNRRQTFEFMRVYYPKSMRNRASKSLPVAWIFVDERGRVAEAKLVTGSGYAELDSLSVDVLSVAEFEPARVGTTAVGVWVPFPVQIPPYDQLIAMLASDGQDVSDAPVETPYTQKPVLLNRPQVEAAIVRVVHGANRQLVEMNEAFARSQRAGGRVDMQIFIGADGVVRNTIVKKTSGNTELDTSAHTIARMMRFSAAKNGDTPVEAWIEVPIVFSAN
ncbi:MAG: TonB family protein, partial [Gemmatimonadota bacterium]